jgi:hypothetical protein
MKKLMAVVLSAVMLFGVLAAVPVQAKDAGSATILSIVMPGAGEWANGNFNGGFPWGECIVGHICFCFMLSSAIDASNGATDTNMRLDFWSAPK